MTITFLKEQSEIYMCSINANITKSFTHLYKNAYLFYRKQMHPNYKHDEKAFNNLLCWYISFIERNNHLSFTIYYKISNASNLNYL